MFYTPCINNVYNFFTFLNQLIQKWAGDAFISVYICNKDKINGV